MQQKFEEILANKQIIVLNIADDYEYMDEELVETLFQNVKNINFWAFQ